MIRYILSLIIFTATISYGKESVTIGFKLVNTEIISDTGAVRDQEEFIYSKNQKIQQLFKEYKVQEFKQLFPSAQDISHPKAKELLEYYYILSGSDDAALLEDIMKREFGDYFKEVHVRDNPVHTIGEYIPNDPVDQSWNLYRILSVKAREAWTITKGSPDIKIAIIEVGATGAFQLTHEDLAGKIVYTNTVNDNVNVHGMYVAGCAAANTDNGVGISAIGFNSSLMLYKGSYNEILDAANRTSHISYFMKRAMGKQGYPAWMNHAYSIFPDIPTTLCLTDDQTLIAPPIITVDSVCGTVSATVSNPPAWATFAWTVSPNLQIVGSSTGSAISYKSLSTGSGWVRASVNYGGGVVIPVTKNVLVPATCPTPCNGILYYDHQTVVVNTSIIHCGNIHSQNVTVNSGVSLVLDATGYVLIPSNFEVPVGATLSINP